MWLACDTGRAGREVWAGWVQDPALVEHQSGPSQRARAGCWQDTWRLAAKTPWLICLGVVVGCEH